MKLLGKACVRSCVQDVFIHSLFGKLKVIVQEKWNIKIIICTRLQLAIMKAYGRRAYSQNYKGSTISSTVLKNHVGTRRGSYKINCDSMRSAFSRQNTEKQLTNFRGKGKRYHARGGRNARSLDIPLFLLCPLRCRLPPSHVKHHKVTSVGRKGRKSIVRVVKVSYRS